MNDIIQAIYLMKLYYDVDEWDNGNNGLGNLISNKAIEFSKILAVDSVLKNKQAKMEDVYELQTDVSEFLEQWSK